MHGDPEPNVATLGTTTATLDAEEEPRRLASLPVAARILGDISEKEVVRRIAAGDIEAVHLGRRHLVVLASLDAYVQRLREQEQQARTEAS